MIGSRYGFLFRRLLSLIPLLLGILLLVMLLLNLTPGDPARLVAGTRAPESELVKVREQLGLDQPIWLRYFDYLGAVLRGDLGSSFKTGQPVADQIAAQLPVTLSIAVLGVLVGLVIAVPLAVLSSRRPDGLADHTIRVLGVLSIGLPSFWVAIMAISLIALPTGWFPVAGVGRGGGDFVRAMVLPSLVVALSIIAPMIRSLRAAMIELNSTEFVYAARTLGFNGGQVTRLFQLRNAVSPLVIVTAAQAGYALFGTVVVEVAFGLPGMGQGLVTASTTRDFPLVRGYTLVFAVLIVLVYLIADLVIAAVDPRVRITA